MTLSSPRDSYQRRAHVRHPLALQTRVTVQDHCTDVRLHNASSGGFRLTLSRPLAALPIGATGDIELPDGTIKPIRIVWQLGGSAGGAFCPPLTDAEMIGLMVLNAQHDQSPDATECRPA
jgi:hypothetical protein